MNALSTKSDDDGFSLSQGYHLRISEFWFGTKNDLRRESESATTPFWLHAAN